jgi:hypothetical protein
MAKALENGGATVYIVGRRLDVVERAAKENAVRVLRLSAFRLRFSLKLRCPNSLRLLLSFWVTSSLHLLRPTLFLFSLLYLHCYAFLPEIR